MDCLDGMLKYIHDLEREFHHQFTEVGRDAKPKAVHKLRLNLKKQKAFFRLMEHLDHTFTADRAQEAYGKLYKRIGKIRNLQVEQMVIREDENLLQLEPSFSQWLSEQEEAQRANLREFEASFSMVPVRRLFSLLRNRLEFIPDADWKPRLDHYFSERFHALRAYGLSAPGRESHFHECRRVVKELWYNFNLVLEQCALSGEAITDLDWLHELQEKLGAWHDRFFCLRHIQKEQPECPAAIPEQLAAEKRILAEQIEEMLDNLNSRLETLQQQWVALLDSQEVPPKPKAAPQPPGEGTHPAFGQLNVSEGTK